jgi:hypothetical protein
MFRATMRALPLLLLLLPACVGLHRRGESTASGTAAAADASIARLQWQEIGRSVQERPLRLLRLGHGPRRVIWIGGIHGDEREGRIATAELPRLFLSTSGAAERVTLTVLEDLNPDGTAANRRGNSRGVDLNRNYPAVNFKPSRLFGVRPLDQPEAKVLHDLVLDERPHLVIVAHSWRDDHFINFDGPSEHLAHRFSQRSGYRVQPSDVIAPTPGSLGSWIGGTLGIPILTLEYRRGREPWAAWHETRDAILDVVLEG